jgi:hypothetical protein
MVKCLRFTGQRAPQHAKPLPLKLSHRRPELRSVLHAAGQLLAIAGQQGIAPRPGASSPKTAGSIGVQSWCSAASGSFISNSKPRI